MGFGLEKLVPIDMVALFLAGINAKNYCLLLVDEFFRFNKIPDKHIKIGLEHTLQALETLSKIYGFLPRIIISSDFMNTQDYKQVLQELEEQIKKQRLSSRLQETAENKYNATNYSLNEIACVEFLKRKHNQQVKFGPSKEKSYDSIMQSLGLDIDFAYVIDAYSLSIRPTQVIHYIYRKEEVQREQRLFLEDSPIKSRFKLSGINEFTSRYLLTLASFAGYRLNQTYLTEKQISELKQRELEEATKALVTANIIVPYREALGGFLR